MTRQRATSTGTQAAHASKAHGGASSDQRRREGPRDSAQRVAGGAPSDPFRVLCVDDHAVLVEGLRAQFQIDRTIEVVGRLPTAARLVEEVERLKPNAVLLDIEMPGPDAFMMADRLKRAHPDVRIIVLSAHIRDSFITASYASGICAYFAKSDELDDIVGGIRHVLRNRPGMFVLGPKVRERCRPLVNGGAMNDLSKMRADAPSTRLTSLTDREAEILRLIGSGLSRVQIAAQLCRSAKTIDAHQSRMMKKLGIDSRADLMRFAIREGFAQA